MREEIQDTKEIKMDPITLAQEIIDGRRITRDDDLSFFLTCDLDELCKGADMIREKFIGDKVDLCSIIKGRSGNALRTANTVRSQHIIIQIVRFMIFYLRKRYLRLAG